MSADKLASAIINDDVDALTQISGVGKKTAARLIVELKSTLEKEWKGEASPVFVKEDTEVVSALLSLGYSLKEAKQAATMISGDGLGVEEKLKLALRNLSKT
jgi:Holliday junction DNA helicase RuvA